MTKDIQPKPTSYADVNFKSRLEARWAVFLDFNQLVDDWDYEPQGFKLEGLGWTYTPDFVVKVGPLDFYLEVKPIIPNEEHLTVLCAFAKGIKVPLILGHGDFFKAIPSVVNLKTIQRKPDAAVTSIMVRENSVTIMESALFPACKDAVTRASRFRFDLATGHERPHFRVGTPGETQAHISQWSTAERKKNKAARRKKGKS